MPKIKEETRPSGAGLYMVFQDGSTKPAVVEVCNMSTIVMAGEILPIEDKFEKVVRELKIKELKLPEDIIRKLLEIVKRRLAAFAYDDNDLRRTTLIVHTIKTGDAMPFKDRVRVVPLTLHDWLKGELDRYLKADLICEADHGKCPYASAIVIVNKKDDFGTATDHRLCIDYRRLNAHTIKDAYPLPRIDDLLHQFGDSKYFSTTDMLMGYNQIGMDPADMYKTAFVTPFGFYMWKVMPFGLCNVPATFQKFVDKLFSKYHDTKAYLDDVISHNADKLEHLKTIDRNLGIFIEANVVLKTRKCRYFCDRVPFVGYILSADGIAADPRKIIRVLDWPFPKTGLGMLSFLGLCNYYRTLIDHFSDLASLLYDASRGDNIEMTPELLAAFDKLKGAMCAAPILRTMDPKLPFILETDASNIAIGAVLKQKFEDGEFPIGYFSKSLTKTERNYSTYERESYMQ